MAEADLDVTIRQIAKAQHRSLIGAAKKRHAELMARAAKAKDKARQGAVQADRQKHHAQCHGHREAAANLGGKRRRQRTHGR